MSFVRVESDYAGSHVFVGKTIVRSYGCIEHIRAAQELANEIKAEIYSLLELSVAEISNEMMETMERIEREP